MCIGILSVAVVVLGIAALIGVTISVFGRIPSDKGCL